jgi:hypothetical protein
MARNRAARVTSATIAEVLAQFLTEQQRRLTPTTFGRYQSAVELLRHSLNNYAYQSLDKSDAERAHGSSGSWSGWRPRPSGPARS